MKVLAATTSQADPVERGTSGAQPGSRDRPDGRREWAPCQNRQQQREARQEDVGAALDGLRDEACPPEFEARACHHAVLKREEGKQGHVHGDGEPRIDDRPSRLML